jgi:TonB-dependent receptor
MKQRRFDAMALAGLVLALLFSINLQAQTGTISGQVVETNLKSALTQARVSVNDSNIAATTDPSGRYTLLGVSEGRVKVTASYLGLTSVTQDVQVIAGKGVVLDFSLEASLKTSVSVTAEPLLEGQARALNDQKESLNLINVVASDQIGRFPDPNAAEATQRIPGVVVQRDQGEGRYVLVRGTEPRLNTTTINGQKIGTTENTSRQIPLDTLPADLLEAIQVAKVLTPDMEGDSIGGAVNLITKRAPATPRFTFTMGLGENSLPSKSIKDFNTSYGRRFLDGKLGMIASGSFYKTHRGSQDIEPAYLATLALADLDLRDYLLTRTRKGFTTDIDYRYGTASSFFIRGIGTEYEDTEVRRRYRMRVSNRRIERLLRDRTHDSTQLAYSAGGSTTLPNSWLLTYDAALSKAKLDTPYRLEATFRQNNVNFNPNVSATFINPSNIQANPQSDVLANYTFNQFAIQNDGGRDRDFSGAFNLTVPVRANFAGNVLKFGIKFRDKDRTRTVNGATQTSPTTLPLTNYVETGYSAADNYIGGKYAFPTEFPSVQAMRDLSRGTTLTTVQNIGTESGSYTAGERVTGFYAMDEIHFADRTTLAPGIRVEHTSVDYSAPLMVFNAAGALVSRTDNPGTDTYTDVMPGIHLRQMFDDKTVLRASFSRTLARPNFGDLAPFVSQTVSDLRISKGNPTLKTTTSNNVDIAVERYFDTVGIASIGGFYKDLSNYIFQATSTQLIGTDTYTVTQPQNGYSASLYGLEATFTKQFRFLPGPLSGIGVYTNYTRIHSGALLPNGRGISLPGQARNMGNAALFYEKYGFTARVSMNVQGRYVLAVGADANTDNWLDQRTEVDFSASKQIQKNVRVFLDMLNLTNDPYRVYQGFHTYPIQEERYKMWWTAGAKVNF